MTYRAAALLQSALYGLLAVHPALAGVEILDAQPLGPMPETYVLVGPEDVTDASDKSGHGADHRVQISVVSTAQGFLAAKTVAAAVCEALEGAVPLLAQGRVVSIAFKRALARRLDGGASRRIDLSFRVRIEA